MAFWDVCNSISTSIKVISFYILGITWGYVTIFSALLQALLEW